MQRNHPDAALAELYRKFELVLEDYTSLKAEVQLLRREAREQHELAIFLLRAVATDLDIHRKDGSAHTGRPAKAQRRMVPRNSLLTS